MSRRAGARHGLAVFAVAVIVGAVIIGLTAWEGGATTLRDNLSSNGVPTDADTWSGIAVGAVVAGAVAMLLGAVLGGLRGERWHGRIEEAAIETRRPEPIDLTAPEHQPSVEDEREQQRQLRDREAGRADQAPTAF